MLLKIVKKGFLRKKIITTALFIFIMLSTLLVASGTSVIIQLCQSLNYLFVKADLPHYIQMHGEALSQTEREAIEKFAADNQLVMDQQTSELLNIYSSNLYLKDMDTAEVNSVMDVSFVKQNERFDYLLNLDNKIVEVAQGNIAVPVYYMQLKDMKLGDSIKVSDGSFEMTFTISDFVRDAQMNSSMISSKRFVMNEADYQLLRNNIDRVGAFEYEIEFKLNNLELNGIHFSDINKLSEFSNEYQAADLPNKGTEITYHVLLLMNAISDGLVAVVIIIISILLIFISLFCLRFTILATLEEEYREIGVMKAIGIGRKDLRKIYLSKYKVMAAAGAVLGYVVSFLVQKVFTKNILLYMGTAPVSAIQIVIPLLAVFIIFLVIIQFCKHVLKKFDKISAVEAIRSGTMGEKESNRLQLKISKSKVMNINILLGIKDVLGRLKLFRLLFFIFFLSAFIIIVPVNFLNTLQSPEFISYMGVGRSDLRFDLQQSEDIDQRFQEVVSYIQDDEDITTSAQFVTCRYQVLGEGDIWENINVEIGDFSVFPLKYLEGAAPANENEIALSTLNASGLKKGVGDTLIIQIGEQQKELTVCGIYQDITNGGKTAKAMFSYNEDSVLWYVISADVTASTSIQEKVKEYSQSFDKVKVTNIDDYIKQTLSATINQIKLLVMLAFLIAVFIAVLITSLFLKMLTAKDSSQIAIMKSLGFPISGIRVQYVTKTLLVLAVGIILGTIAANTLGEGLVSTFMSAVGASKIEFIINPWMSYLLCPCVLILTVVITTFLSVLSIGKFSITKTIVE